MARHCVKYAGGKKKKKGRKGKSRNCRFGVVRRGRRKGQCLKSKRSRRK
jgi:hypothetical protein